MKSLKFLAKFEKGSWHVMALHYILLFMQEFLGQVTPFIVALILDYCLLATSATTPPGGVFSFLFNGSFGAIGTIELTTTLALFLILEVLVRDNVERLAHLVAHIHEIRVSRALRATAFNHMLKTETSLSDGEVYNILNFDSPIAARILTMQLPITVNAFFAIFLGILFLSGINILLLIIPVIAIPFLVIYSIKFIKETSNISSIVRENKSLFIDEVKRNIEGHNTYKIFNTTELSKKSFTKNNVQYTDSVVHNQLIANKYNLIFNIIKTATFMMSLAVAGILAINKMISLGEFSVFISFVDTILKNVIELSQKIAAFVPLNISSKKVQKFLENKEVAETENPDFSNLKGTEIKLTKTSVTLAGSQILDNISMVIKPGEKLGIVGISGSGKSILMQCLNRKIKPTGGEILFNKINANELSKNQISSVVAYSSQKPNFFRGNVKYNITFGSSFINEQELNEVLDLSLASEGIERLSSGLREEVDNDAINLGNLKYRIAIARTLLKKADVYLFDELFLNYAKSEERKLLSNILTKLKDKTVVITSGNIEQLKKCDKILVLHKGKLVDYGNYKQLKQPSSAYSKHIKNLASGEVQ